MMNKGEIKAILVKHNIPVREGKSFTFALTRAEAELITRTYGWDITIMCKEYGMDSGCEGEICGANEPCTCWDEINLDDLNDDGTFDEDYETFEIWVG